MESASTCKRCHGGMTDTAAICHPCTTHLAGRLNDVPVLLQQLDITLTRQGSRTGPPIASTGSGSVYPDMTISMIAGLLRSACAGWAHTYDGYIGPRPWFHLATAIRDIRKFNWAVQLDADLTRRSITAWQRIDRPPQRWYAGVCGFGTPGDGECRHVLWTGLEDVDITCPRCRTVWSVAERRDHLIRAAEDVEGNATVVASVASYVTRKRVPAATVRSWSFRGLLAPRAPASYRVGDVIALALRDTSPAA